MRHSAWLLALGLAVASPSLAAEADSSHAAPALKRPRVAAPT